MGSKFGAEQQAPTDSRSSTCSARRPLRARSTSPDRARLRSAGTKPESTAPFRRRPCASRAASRPTGLDRAPFAPGRPEKGILAPRRPRTTPGLANARDSAPLAASTATVLEASATVPAACASSSESPAVPVNSIRATRPPSGAHSTRRRKSATLVIERMPCTGAVINGAIIGHCNGGVCPAVSV